MSRKNKKNKGNQDRKEKPKHHHLHLAEVTWPQMIRDLAQYAVEKSVIVPFFTMTIIIIMVWPLTPEARERVIFGFLEFLKHSWTIGYFLFVLALAAWYYHSRYMRKQYQKELERIGKEKTELQNMLRQFESSEPNYKIERGK